VKPVAIALFFAGAAAAQGDTIYLEGRTAAGAPIEASRAGGAKLHGAEAACVNCHRRSGFGSSEGRSYIPPINGTGLFQPALPGTGVAAGKGRPAYTEASLARALRTGVDPSGRRLDYLMPRYKLAREDIKGVETYLRGLSSALSPGVEANQLHFATVVAPGIEPAPMLDALASCFASQNAGRVPPKGRKRYAPSMRFEVRHQWRLHVWTLHGEPQTWRAQLEREEQRQPVFAIVGGIGRGTWWPVQAFCEARGVPCLFPHVEAPPPTEPGFYSMYLSRGVLLEAALIAGELASAQHVVQVRRPDDDAAVRASVALAAELRKSGAAIETVSPEAFAPREDQPAVLWLRERDLGRLPPGSPVYLSATLAGKGVETKRASARVVSPYVQIPEDAVRADGALACRALRAAMQDIGEHLHRDFLVERVEAQMERLGAPAPYARLSLGFGQRFAAKSGFVLP
jgi:mono/diheme cytochrome c family protein